MTISSRAKGVRGRNVWLSSGCPRSRSQRATAKLRVVSAATYRIAVVISVAPDALRKIGIHPAALSLLTRKGMAFVALVRSFAD